MKKNINNIIKPILQRAVNAIYPPQCLSCREIVSEEGNMCSQCWEGATFIADPICHKCGIPFELNVAQETWCGDCMQCSPKYNKARAVFVYDDNSQRLISKFKYSDKTSASPYLARWMLRVGSGMLHDCDFVAPVPLHRNRLIYRRYNQAALLCKSIEQQTSKTTVVDLLKRVKNTPSQARLTTNQRKINVSGAFSLNEKYSDYVVGKNILLVDDVMTTGATIEACAKILLQAGADKINILTIARTTKG